MTFSGSEMQDLIAYLFFLQHLDKPGKANRGARLFDDKGCGVFDKDGRVLAEPPPRPLDRYEVKIESGVVYVGQVYRVNDQLQRIS